LHSLFHMSNDSELFLNDDKLTARIRERVGVSAVIDDESSVYPLYEGKMFWHFDHRYGTYEGQTLKQANKGVLPSVSDSQHDDPNYRIRPRYWVRASDLRTAVGRHAEREWCFSWRDVGISERTFIGAIIP